MKWVFVTATDTEAGKTTFCSLWLKRLCAQGVRPAALKPVASGARDDTTQTSLRNNDALELWQSAGGWQSYEEVNPLCFVEPVAPHIAARKAGLKLNVQLLEERCANLWQQRAELGVVEGAGGFLLPLEDGATLADWVAQHGWGVVMVVPLQLGCLNHALLTAEAIGSRRLPLLGWVANLRDQSMPYQQDNLDLLEDRLPAPKLANMVCNAQGRPVLQPTPALESLEIRLLARQRFP